MPQLPHGHQLQLKARLPSSEAVHVDVKDWANPSLLAVRTQALRADPPRDCAFIVVPAYRFRAREDYARAFRHALATDLHGQITAKRAVGRHLVRAAGHAVALLAGPQCVAGSLDQPHLIKAMDHRT